MTAVEKVRAAWGDNPPREIVALAERCDETSQSRTAAAIGKSAGTVSQLLGNTYGADPGRVFETIRARLLPDTVTCPVLGEIPFGECLEWQGRPFAATNHQRAAIYRACRSGCPHSKIGGDT